MGEDCMKPSYCITIICICLILSSLTGVVAADSAQYDKCVSIHLNIDNGKITTKSTEIYYGSAPHLFPMQEGFKAELVAADGSTVKTFTVWDPRIQFGDVIVSNSNGPQIHGVLDRQNTVDSVVTFPFDREVTEFRLYNSAEGTLLASVNLKPQIDSFFASYPNDPDNPALSGSRTPVTANTPQTGTPDPGATSSGQLWGILVIGSGAALLLIGVFASLRFLRVSPQSVLIVDDDRDMIEVINGMLKLGGYATRIATSGAECLKELESAVPDLILLDIVMNPMDGWETLKRIKKNPVTKGIPTIMLTGQKLTPKDVEDYGIYIEDYVMKPVTVQGLNAAITHVFARRQMINEKIAAAKRAGIDRDKLCEGARLTRVVDVNKRLWDLLVKTYNLEAGVLQGADNEIAHAIENIEGTFRDQEHRLEQLQWNLSSGATG
jgi:CheY-like chemotaxis protein